MHITLQHNPLLVTGQANGKQGVSGKGLWQRLLQGVARHGQTQASLRPLSMRHVPEHIWRRHSALLMSRVDE